MQGQRRSFTSWANSPTAATPPGFRPRICGSTGCAPLHKAIASLSRSPPSAFRRRQCGSAHALVLRPCSASDDVRAKRSFRPPTFPHWPASARPGRVHLSLIAGRRALHAILLDWLSAASRAPTRRGVGALAAGPGRHSPSNGAMSAHVCACRSRFRETTGRRRVPPLIAQEAFRSKHRSAARVG